MNRTEILLILIVAAFCGCKSIKRCNKTDASIYKYIIQNDLDSSYIIDSIDIIYLYDKSIYENIGMFKNPIKEILPDSAFFKLVENYNSVNSNACEVNIGSSIRDSVDINYLSGFPNLSSLTIENGNKTIAFFKFSKPTFLHNNEYALVYRALTQSSLCGFGEVFILKKNYKTWITVFRKIIWLL